MTDDTDALRGYVEAWQASVESTVALLRDLDEADCSLPTDLAGWDVKAVASHLAHMESELAGNPQEQVEVKEADHITGIMGVYTEMGVIARRDWPLSRIVDELEASAKTRAAQLAANPPADGSAIPETTPGGIGWSWSTLLSNRALDMWMHEQDIRRAVGRPGGLDSLGGRHALDVLAKALPYIVGKGAGAPPRTTAVLTVTGPQSGVFAVEVPPEGRTVPMSKIPADPTVSLIMDFETAAVLTGGRRSPDDVAVGVTGDRELARSILGAMAITP